MPRSRQCFSYASFAKHGATVALAAVLAVSSVPAAAMVQAASGESPQLAYAVENGEVQTPDGFYMVPGQSYEIGIECSAMGTMEPFGTKAQVSYGETSGYTILLTVDESLASMIGDITFNGSVASKTGNQVSLVGVESIKSAITLSAYINAPMNRDVSLTLNVTDTSNLPTESTTPSEPDTGGTEEGGEGSGTTGEGGSEEGGDTGEVTDPATETKSVSYFVKDSGNAFSGMLSSDVQVAQNDEGSYDISLSVSAEAISSVDDTFWVADATGNKIDPVEEQDGSYTYTIQATSIDGAVEFAIGYTAPIPNHPMEMTHNMIMRFFDCTAINNALSAAGSIKDDGTEAYATFEQAYAAVKETVSNPTATADDLNNAAAQLNTAIEAYNATTGEGEGSETVTTPDGLELVAGETYNAPVSFWKTNGTETSMAADYMNKVAQVVYDADSKTYTVTITTTNPEYISNITCSGATVDQSGSSYTISGIADITSDITLGMTIKPMQDLGLGSVEALMRIDTDNMVLASEGNPPVVDDETTNNNNQNNNNNNNNGQNNTTVSTARFVVGHTYEVPLSIMQSGTSTTSMAAQYFGDSAYVRPLENGTMDISFTTNRLDYINSLSYNGSELSRSGSTFTVNVPYTESDLVLRMAMGIAPMQELGMGTVTADFHFQLSQANDLGTNVTSNPSSASSLPKTADTTNGVAGLAALAGAGLVAAGVSRFARRRS